MVVAEIAASVEIEAVAEATLAAGARAVRATALPPLFEGYDQVWHW